MRTSRIVKPVFSNRCDIEGCSRTAHSACAGARPRAPAPCPGPRRCGSGGARRSTTESPESPARGDRGGAKGASGRPERARASAPPRATPPSMGSSGRPGLARAVPTEKTAATSTSAPAGDGSGPPRGQPRRTRRRARARPGPRAARVPSRTSSAGTANCGPAPSCLARSRGKRLLVGRRFSLPWSRYNVRTRVPATLVLLVPGRHVMSARFASRRAHLRARWQTRRRSPAARPARLPLLRPRPWSRTRSRLRLRPTRRRWRASARRGSPSPASSRFRERRRARAQARAVLAPDDAPADTRVDGFAGWDDLPRGFMNAVFELLHEQTNAHRLVRAPNRRARSARALLGDELVAWVRFFFGPALRLTHHSIFLFLRSLAYSS